ncbi:MAG: ribosome maturation factor RimM [Lachnospiraceae bacterium]|nr:ribosome maturation factor RimM [Lachnospiraceae bacterium]MDY6222318.1 ribosome maturation factor RimM [Candidatus Alectryocaccobium sp.]
MEQYLRVGVITTTHGLRGEVKVFPTTDSKERFLEIDEVVLRTSREETVLHIEKVRFFKQLVIVKFKEYNRIEDVENLKQAELYVSRDNAAPLEEGEYYIGDLIGMKVFTDDGEEFGEISDVMETGANDVYVIDTQKYGEVLIPAIKQCILEVDIQSERMTIHLLPGLI